MDKSKALKEMIKIKEQAMRTGHIEIRKASAIMTKWQDYYNKALEKLDQDAMKSGQSEFKKASANMNKWQEYYNKSLEELEEYKAQLILAEMENQKEAKSEN